MLARPKTDKNCDRPWFRGFAGGYPDVSLASECSLNPGDQPAQMIFVAFSRHFKTKKRTRRESRGTRRGA